MSGMRLILVALLTMLLPLGAVNSAERDVRGWLQGMVASVRNLNYQGTFVYLHDNQLESMQIIHSVDASGEKEHLISLNGAAREVVRDDASVTCIRPDAKSISVSRRSTGGGFRAVFSMDIDQLSEYYDFQLLERVRVAGKEAQIVAILPKDRFRYGYKIYLDTENQLPLKTDMLSDNGAAISQIMFTSIQVDSKPVGEVYENLDGREYYQWEQRKPEQVTDGSTSGDWTFQTLPKGYKVRFRAQIPGAQGHEPISHIVLSDGLASLSLYIESAGAGDGLIGASKMGAVNAYGQLSGDHHVTAVGAVPAFTVETIASAVTPNIR